MRENQEAGSEPEAEPEAEEEVTGTVYQGEEHDDRTNFPSPPLPKFNQ